MPRQIITIVVILAALGLAACGGPKGPVGQGSTERFAPPPERPRSLAEQADAAWRARDYARSEYLYGRLLAQDDVSEADRRAIADRYVRSAIENGRCNAALSGLDAWAEALPDAYTDPRWQDLRARAYACLGDGAKPGPELAASLAKADIDPDRRARDAMANFRYLVDENRSAEALEFLDALYVLAPDDASRAALERELRIALTGLTPHELERLAIQVEEAERLDFPGALVAFVHARRTLEADADNWPTVWNELRTIADRAALADPAVLELELMALETQFGTPRSAIVLFVPLEGRFAEIGWKIADGASVAQWQATGEGRDVELIVINTEAADWLEQAADLPPNAAIAGGPIRRDKLLELREAGLLAARPHFAFMSGLGQIEEGYEAWRFFTSPADQVRVMADMARTELDIIDFGVLYPQEPYGLRMRQVIDETVAETGGYVAASESYPPGDHPAWSKSVASFLGVPLYAKKRPDPKTPYQAVFIPDSWPQAELLVPHLFYFGEDRLVILGSELWSQALPHDKTIESRYFRLAVCPGPWDPEARTPAMLDLIQGLDQAAMGEPDSWTGLGFDFVRFARRLAPLDDDWLPRTINERLPYAAGLDFVQAPMQYDDAGRCRQQLYLFQPSRAGLVRLDPQELRQRMQTVREQHEKIRETFRQ